MLPSFYWQSDCLVFIELLTLFVRAFYYESIGTPDSRFSVTNQIAGFKTLFYLLLKLKTQSYQTYVNLTSRYDT